MKFLGKIIKSYTKKVTKMPHPVLQTSEANTAIVSIKVLIIPVLQDNYSFIVTSGNKALVIDPSDSNSIAAEIEKRNMSLDGILVTHDHNDHIGGAVKLQEKYHTSVIVCKGSSVPCSATEINDGYTLSFAESTFEAIEVPGHSLLPYPLSDPSTNIAWYNPTAKILFTGDTLFPCGYGYIPHGAEKMMWKSLKRLRSLPEDTLIFCGHEYTFRNTTFAREIDPDNKMLEQRIMEVNRCLEKSKPTIPTTLKQEKEMNPFLRWDDTVLKKRLGILGKGEFETFLHIRKLKNEFNKRTRT